MFTHSVMWYASDIWTFKAKEKTQTTSRPDLYLKVPQGQIFMATSVSGPMALALKVYVLSLKVQVSAFALRVALWQLLYVININ